MDIEPWVWVGLAITVIHFAIVGITYFVAAAADRNALGWAGVAMITGPFALIAMYFWRGEARGRPQPGQS